MYKQLDSRQQNKALDELNMLFNFDMARPFHASYDADLVHIMQTTVVGSCRQEAGFTVPTTKHVAAFLVFVENEEKNKNIELFAVQVSGQSDILAFIHHNLCDDIYKGYSLAAIVINEDITRVENGKQFEEKSPNLIYFY